MVFFIQNFVKVGRIFSKNEFIEMKTQFREFLWCLRILIRMFSSALDKQFLRSVHSKSTEFTESHSKSTPKCN